MTKLALSKYWQRTDKIPQERTDIWKEFNGSFKNKDVDPSLLPTLVKKGFCFTSQLNGYRKKANFLCSQFLALDIDDGTGIFEKLLTDDFIKHTAYLLYTTPSHTIEHPRTRVVFVLDTVVDDVEVYEEMIAALLHKYNVLADEHCKDASRFYYGSLDCETMVLGNTLTIERFTKEILLPFRQKKAKEEQLRKERLAQITICQPSNVPQKILNIHLEKLLEHVRNARDGEKHLTLLRIATTIGGYITPGYYDFNHVNKLLQDAIVSNPHNVKNMQHAFDTIEKSLYHGMESPLYFEDRYSSEIDKLDLSDDQRKGVEQVVWKAYTDGLTDGQKQQWYNLGFNEAIVEKYNLGYCDRFVDKETGMIVNNALTVPFIDYNGDTLNIEYRHEQGYDYTHDLPVLFYTEPSDKQMVVLPDSITALKTYLQIGFDYQIVGLPHMDIVKDTIDYDGAIVILEPDTKDRNFKSVRNHCRFLRLRQPIEKLIYSMDYKDFGWLLVQAERF